MLKEILLLNPIYVTLFWAIVLNTTSRSKHLPKFFLGTFMIVASVVYLSHFFYFTERFIQYFYIDSFYTLAYLSVYPLYHIYVRLLTVDSKVSVRKHGIYLLTPFILFTATGVGYLVLGKVNGIGFIESVLVQGNKPQGFQVYMFTLFVAGRIVFLLQTAIYLILSFKLIRTNNIRLKDYYSNMEERKLNWVQFFNISFALTSVSSAVLAAVGRNVFLNNDTLLIFPSVVFTVMLFFIGLLGSKQKAIFTEIDGVVEYNDEAKPPKRLREKLDSLFEKEKIYKNPDLKIWDVSSMLGTNRTYISRTINSEYGRNFCAHVNYYRVSYAKLLINNNPNLTNEQIAELSGFGSTNSLYRAFLNTESISLGQFRKQFQN